MILDVIGAIQNPPFLNLQEVKKFKKKFEAIDKFMTDPSLSIAFILGPSGCGKAYLLYSYLEAKKMKYSIYTSMDKLLKGTPNQPNRQSDLYGHLLSTQGMETLVFLSFPQPSFEACNQFYEYMCHYKGKVVFALNSDQHTAKSLTKFLEVRNQKKNLSLQNGILYEFSSYTKTDLVNIIATFCGKTNCKLPYEPAVLEEIIELFGGDARRILNELYFRANVMNKVKERGELNESRFSIFHFLGKLLYNKRLVVPGIQHGKAKSIQNELYRQMSSEELKKYDPPFYFDPVELIRETNLPFNIVMDFIAQNFGNFYNSPQDSKNMSDLLARMYDKKNSEFVSDWKVEESIDDLDTLLLSHGVMIYNLHGAQLSKSFTPFKTPLSWQLKKECYSKQHLLATNLPGRTLQEISQLYELSNYLLEKDFPLMRLINLIMGSVASQNMDGGVHKNDMIPFKYQESLLDTNFNYMDSVPKTIQYDQISESESD